jgi:hypothetical protein
MDRSKPGGFISLNQLLWPTVDGFRYVLFQMESALNFSQGKGVIEEANFPLTILWHKII